VDVEIDGTPGPEELSDWLHDLLPENFFDMPAEDVDYAEALDAKLLGEVEYDGEGFDDLLIERFGEGVTAEELDAFARVDDDAVAGDVEPDLELPDELTADGTEAGDQVAEDLGIGA